MEVEWADQLENMDIKPAAKIDPIKTSQLGKRLREPESEPPVDMRPIHQLSAISKNPFNTEAFLENLKPPVVTELNLIGQGNPQTIESGIHTQSIIDRTSEIIQSDIMTHLVTDHSQTSLKSKSFPFHKKEAPTLMFTPFVQAFLTRNGRIRTTGKIGTSRPDHSRILTPGMNEDILSGNNVTNTVRSDVRVTEKLDTTIEPFTSN